MSRSGRIPISIPESTDVRLESGVIYAKGKLGELSFNYENNARSVSKYDLVDRYNLLFKYTNSKNIDDLMNNINRIKQDLSLENKLSKINKKIPGKLNLILDGINIQRLNNNPIKIEKKNILGILKKII